VNAGQWAAITAGCAAFLAPVIPAAARTLRARRHRAPPLPRRTRAPAGLPRDGARLTWGETQAWTGLVRRWGPHEPTWPGARQKGTE